MPLQSSTGFLRRSRHCTHAEPSGCRWSRACLRTSRRYLTDSYRRDAVLGRHFSVGTPASCRPRRRPVRPARTDGLSRRPARSFSRVMNTMVGLGRVPDHARDDRLRQLVDVHAEVAVVNGGAVQSAVSARATVGERDGDGSSGYLPRPGRAWECHRTCQARVSGYVAVGRSSGHVSSTVTECCSGPPSPPSTSSGSVSGSSLTASTATLSLEFIRTCPSGSDSTRSNHGALVP